MNDKKRRMLNAAFVYRRPRREPGPIVKAQPVIPDSASRGIPGAGRFTLLPGLPTP